MGGSAHELYNQGITMSLTEYGYDGNDLAGNDYVYSMNTTTKPDAGTAPVSTVPIDYEPGASKERKLEQLITQKWIALYPDREEAWAERRRTGYPTIFIRLLRVNPEHP